LIIAGDTEVTFTDSEGLLLNYNSDVQQERCTQIPKQTTSLSMNGNLFAGDKTLPPLNTSILVTAVYREKPIMGTE